MVGIVYVISERAGSVAEKTPLVIVSASCRAMSLVVFVMYGTTYGPLGMPLLGSAMGIVTA